MVINILTKGIPTMKKILSASAAILLAASLSTNALAAVTMYAADGRTITVPDHQVAAYEAVSWFTAPPVIMHAEDGRTIQVSGDKVEAYKKVGWYTAPPVKMYAADGRTILVSGDEVEAYKRVGWYVPAMVTMHAADGRTITIPENQIDAYKAVGWYTSKPVTMYAADGRTILVSVADIEAYKRVGWYTEPQTSSQGTQTPYVPTTSGVALSSEQVYAMCSPAVFYLIVYNAEGYATGSGSGFFIDSDGTAVTNYHVIDGAATAKVQLAHNGAVHDVVGVYDYDKDNDWAVIKVNCSGNPVLRIGSPSTIVGGASIFTIGSPEGYQNTISQGIISNPDRIESGVNYIQITAPLSHGSSGGALINKYGEAIGITTAIHTEGQNLNFALPISVINGYKKEGVTTLLDLSRPAVPQGNVTYYRNFYGVPDFGWVAGAAPSDTYSSSSGYSYDYSVYRVDSDDITNYISVLEMCGYQQTGSFEDDNGFTVLVYKNSYYGYTVMMGVTVRGTLRIFITRS